MGLNKIIRLPWCYGSRVTSFPRGHEFKTAKRYLMAALSSQKFGSRQKKNNKYIEHLKDIFELWDEIGSAKNDLRSSFQILKYGPNPASFCFFSSFYQNNDKYCKKIYYQSVDGVLGIRTRDRRMVGGNKSTELWRPPPNRNYPYTLAP